MAIPSTPQNIIVQQANGQALISWNLVPGALTYNVQRSTDQVTYVTIATISSIQFLDTTVTVGTQYFYQVASTNLSGTSPFSLPQSVIPATTGTLSLGELRYRAQQRADRVNSQFVSTEEWNSYINQSYFELYDLLVQKYGNEYFVAPPLQFRTTGAMLYDLPNGINYSGAPAIYKLLGMDLGISAANQAWITLKKFQFISRNRYVYPQLTTNLLGIAGLRYRLLGSQIEFIPAPSAGQLLQMWYIPRMRELLLDTDICDGVSGWTEYIITDAAIKALQKEEQDITVLGQQKMMLIDRIECAAENRDAGEPDTISDTRRYTDLYGFGSPSSDGPYGGY